MPVVQGGLHIWKVLPFFLLKNRSCKELGELASQNQQMQTNYHLRQEKRSQMVKSYSQNSGKQWRMGFDNGLKLRDADVTSWTSTSTTPHLGSVRLGAYPVPTQPWLIFTLDPLSRCCDKCNPVSDPTAATCSRPSTPIQNIQHVSPPCTPSSSTNATGKRPMEQDLSAVMRRTGQHLQSVRQALEHWRIQVRRRDYPHCSFSATTIMPDRTLTTLASKRSLRSAEDLRKQLSPPWDFAEEYADEVLQLLTRLDANAEAERKRGEAEKQERKRQVREEKKHRKAIVKMQRQLARASANVQAMAIKENIPLHAADGDDRYVSIPFFQVYCVHDIHLNCSDCASESETQAQPIHGGTGGVFSVFSVVPSPRSPLWAPHSALMTFSPNGFIQSNMVAQTVPSPATATPSKFSFRPIHTPTNQTPIRRPRKAEK